MRESKERREKGGEGSGSSLSSPQDPGGSCPGRFRQMLGVVWSWHWVPEWAAYAGLTNGTQKSPPLSGVSLTRSQL